MQFSRSFRLTIGISMLVALAGPQVTAGANPKGGGTQVVGTSEVTYVDPAGQVLVLHPRRDLTDKSAYDPDADAAVARLGRASSSGDVSILSSSCQFARNLAASKSMEAWAPGKPHSTVYVSFSTAFNFGINGLTGAITDYCISGHSLVRWYGSDPVNGALIGLTDTWHASGLAISGSYPGGVGFSGSGDTITFFPGNASNTWKEDHYYSGVHFTGLVLLGCSESASGQIKLGTNWFYPVASKNC